ncbi:MAG: hypothetical protein WCX73_02995 [Candidatus Pacearchaeota archaeon]|jgi:hypothetical protein
MEKNQIIALIIGILGLIVMFLFPSPEENFIYYVGFIVIVFGLIFWVLKGRRRIK